MTRILSWNIQNGLSPRGDVSLRRVADVIGAMGAPDVICLQEVSRGLKLSDEAGAPDQVAELATLFPHYEVIFGAAFDAHPPTSENRWQYGNAILTRLPLLLVMSHPLPRPGVEGVRHMIRQASEIVVDATAGPLRIVNLHLEFHSVLQRLAQIDRLRELLGEALEQETMPPRTDPQGPYQAIPRPVDGVFCGDFNLLPGGEEYRRLLAPLAGRTQPLRDAWELVHPGRPHDPTCGVYDRKQWPEGPHCRDYFFVAGGCIETVSDLRVDTATDASDHQPSMLELGSRRRRDEEVAAG